VPEPLPFARPGAFRPAPCPSFHTRLSQRASLRAPPPPHAASPTRPVKRAASFQDNLAGARFLRSSHRLSVAPPSKAWRSSRSFARPLSHFLVSLCSSCTLSHRASVLSIPHPHHVAPHTHDPTTLIQLNATASLLLALSDARWGARPAVLQGGRAQASVPIEDQGTPLAVMAGRGGRCSSDAYAALLADARGGGRRWQLEIEGRALTTSPRRAAAARVERLLAARAAQTWPILAPPRTRQQGVRPDAQEWQTRSDPQTQNAGRRERRGRRQGESAARRARQRGAQQDACACDRPRVEARRARASNVLTRLGKAQLAVPSQRESRTEKKARCRKSRGLWG
jgi:hypothetical protein